MAQQQVLEGTWEQVRAHDAELTGRHVRLIIIDTQSANPSAKGTIIRLGMFPQLRALKDEDFKRAEYL